MSISLLRFIRNPKNSFEKTYSLINTFFFSRYVNKILSKSDASAKNDTPLDSIFIDKRDSHDSVIEKIRSIATNILSIIDYLGTQYKFDYFLAYGTLIGAIRHQDFIPWDDDIDIMMSNEDLKKLLSVTHLLPDNLEVKVMANNFIKILDKNSKISLDGKRGVAVDIFILDTKDDKYSFKNVHNNKWIKISKSDWFPIMKHPFGENKFNIPKNYDDILTQIYGNYMKLPPVEERVYSHIDISKTIFKSTNTP